MISFDENFKSYIKKKCVEKRFMPYYTKINSIYVHFVMFCIAL